MRLSFFLVALSAMLGACAHPPPAPVVSVPVPKPEPPVQTIPAQTVKPPPSKPLVEAPAAPVVAVPEKDRPVPTGMHRVKRGETLIGISLEYGVDWRDLVVWNQISNPNRIEVGQLLAVRAPAASLSTSPLAAAPAPAAQSPAVPAPAVPAPAVPAPAVPAPAVPAGGDFSPGRIEVRPLAPVASAPPAVDVPAAPPAADAAAAPPPAAAPAVDAPAAPPPAAPPPAAPPPAAPPPAAVPPAPSPETAENLLNWAWPAHGGVITQFAEGGSKGISIAGAPGEAVFAAERGRVVYSGNGLKGYGNLVIVKHANDFITAYAHNRAVLVKEGQNVRRGQKIAELGMTDADRPMLLFELRKGGKPLDPMGFLPSR